MKLLSGALRLRTTLPLHFFYKRKSLDAYIFELPTVPSTPLFHSVRILKLEDLFHLNLLKFVYKAINKNLTIIFS